MANYVFSDVGGTQDGLIQECEDICNLGAAGISGNTAKLKTFTRRLNQAKDKFFTIAQKYDVLWNWDDRRFADSDLTLPIATTNIVSGTKDYLFNEELLVLVQVFVKDSSGTFHELTPQDDRNSPRAYDLQSSTGTPTSYELVGNSILLDATPNYSSTGGLKVVFKRKATNFVYTDGAVPISVPQIFFSYLANAASLPYLREKSLKHYPAVKQDVEEMELVLIPQFIANRAKPRRAGLKVAQEDNR
jgi:hypothetical protein